MNTVSGALRRFGVRGMHSVEKRSKMVSEHFKTVKKNRVLNYEFEDNFVGMSKTLKIAHKTKPW